MRIGWILGFGFVIASCGSGSDSTGNNPSDGGAGKDGAASCNDFEAQYGTALQAAKSCTPNASTNECTLQVANALRCACGSTYVNASDTSDVKTLGNLGLAWDSAKCSDGIGCPNIFCPPASSGTCKPDPSGSTGTCSDVFSDAGP